MVRRYFIQAGVPHRSSNGEYVKYKDVTVLMKLIASLIRSKNSEKAQHIAERALKQK
jgi:hypothetical protein